MKKRCQTQKGFTLIELLIVIAVIAILAALAIPNLIGSRKAANETNAISELRTIITVEEAYKTRNFSGTNSYGLLSDLESNNLMVWPLPGTYKKDNYTFTDIGTPAVTAWGVYAAANDSNSGDRNFLATNDGQVRQDAKGNTGTPPADVPTAQNNTNYPPLQ